MSGRRGKARRAPRVTGAVGGASLLVFALPAAIGVPSASAQVTPGVYNLVASGDTTSFEWNVQKAPLVAPQVAFVSPGSVGIELNSYGDSKGFAGAPFFGATVEGAGGLANGLGQGRIPPLPSTLPGYVTSSNPVAPASTASNGPYTLQAQSDEHSSSATAGIAGVSGQPTFLATTAHALGNFDSPTGALTAAAESITEPFEIGSLVTVGKIRSFAQMVLNQDGKLVPSSTFDVGTITVAGVKLGLTDQGVQIADKSATPVSLGQLNDALAPSGISFKLLSGVTTPTSVISDGLQITLAHDVPAEGATSEVITLGHASAQLKYTLVKNSLTAPVTGALGGVIGNPPSGSDLAGLGELPSTVGLVPGTAPAAVELQPQAVTTAGQSRLLSDARMDFGHWYLVLLVAGLSLTLGSRLIGLFGIRKLG
jgi:hypothetical protein